MCTPKYCRHDPSVVSIIAGYSLWNRSYGSARTIKRTITSVIDPIFCHLHLHFNLNFTTVLVQNNKNHHDNAKCYAVLNLSFWEVMGSSFYIIFCYRLLQFSQTLVFICSTCIMMYFKKFVAGQKSLEYIELETM